MLKSNLFLKYPYYICIGSMLSISTFGMFILTSNRNKIIDNNNTLLIIKEYDYSKLCNRIYHGISNYLIIRFILNMIYLHH